MNMNLYYHLVRVLAEMSCQGRIVSVWCALVLSWGSVGVGSMWNTCFLLGCHFSATVVYLQQLRGLSQGTPVLGSKSCKSSVQDMEGFCVTFGYLESDFLLLFMAGLYGPGLGTVLYRFQFALTFPFFFVFPLYLSGISETFVSQCFPDTFCV